MEDELSRYRRLNWWGAKRLLKSALGLRPFNDAARAALKALSLGPRYSAFPVNLPEVSGAVGEARFVMLEPMRCSIARELYWGGGRRLVPSERFALELFCRLAKDRDVVLDIGANTGIFSLAAARANPRLEVHAFEIVPEVFDLLYRNCARNDILDRATCHHFGLGKDGASIRLPEPVEGGSLPLSFSSRWDGGQGRRIGFHSLDSLLPLFPDRGRRILAKIDVEGTEDEVFRCGKDFLAVFAPDMVCEILPDCAKVDFIEPLLRELGYSFFKIGADSLIKSERLTADGDFHDWFFTTRPGATP